MADDEPMGTTDARRLVRHVFTVIGVVFVALAMFLVFNWGYSKGKADKALDFAREAECRAEAAGPVNDATARINAATARGLAVTVARGTPRLEDEIERRLGDPPDQALLKEFNEILDASDDLLDANDLRGADPVAACRDLDPGDRPPP